MLPPGTGADSVAADRRKWRTREGLKDGNDA